MRTFHLFIYRTRVCVFVKRLHLYNYIRMSPVLYNMIYNNIVLRSLFDS